MSKKRNYRHKFNAEEQAAYNIQNGKGWMCPTCGSFIPAGEDQCYACGEMPEVNGQTMQLNTPGYFGYDFFGHRTDLYLLPLLFWFASFCIVPILGMVNEFSNTPLVSSC